MKKVIAITSAAVVWLGAIEAFAAMYGRPAGMAFAAGGLVAVLWVNFLVGPLLEWAWPSSSSQSRSATP